MSALTAYVEQAKVEEVAEQLRQQGYAVAPRQDQDAEPFDLVATRGDERLAVEVTSLSQVRGRGRTLQDLRNRALHDGFTEFRLVVASPPREKHITVDHINQEIMEYLFDNIPSPLQNAASNARIDSVDYLDIDAIHVNANGIEIEGTGVVSVTLEYGGSRDGTASDESFPFRFDVLLGHDLRVKEAYELEVDVSSLDEQ